MFIENDLKQILAKGLTKEKVEQQINNFVTGFPFANIVNTATPENGIVVLNNSEVSDIVEFYKNESKKISITKFVPASGAASRMFKDLFEFLNSENSNFTNFSEVKTFFERLKDFAFYAELTDVLSKNNIDENDYKKVLEFLLSERGLNYGFLPKALIKFHKYKINAKTSIEEHLFEAASYAKNDKKQANLVFTVSADHNLLFQQKINEVKAECENMFDVKFNIELTEQKQSTDIIAVDENNLPFREKDGSLIFRPGGHGALIENLNEIDADIIFIKNIDNVVHQNFAGKTIDYKQVIAGVLLKTKAKVNELLNSIENNNFNADEVAKILNNEFAIKTSQEFKKYTKNEKTDYLKTKLNRPIRVCGMVKNEGEPGGGPFWVKEADGTVQLQIVESAEIDKKNVENSKILNTSTHFNPVDLVCSTKDYKNQKFDLLNFVNYSAGFISEKSKNGKALKAQELPGLWNGAMSNWITLFVEVPLITFNPVKTVNDLLRKEHLEIN